MKYVVTGGAGFIGSHITEALVGKNDVIIVDDLFSGKTNNLTDFQDSIQFIKGSITDLPHMKDL